MNVLRKILAIIVMILAGLGMVLCAAGLIGAWVVNAPAKNAVTGALGAVESYAALANQTLQGVGDNVSEVKAEVEQVNQRLANVTDQDRAQLAAAVQQKLDQTIGPKLERANATANAIGQTAVKLNQTLESVNRIPGVAVPTFTDELQAIGARVQDAEAAVAEVRSTVSDANFDGSRAQAATARITSGLNTVQETLTKAQARLASASTAVTAVGARVTGWIDLISIFSSLLFVLFGAGQFFLFKAALNWFRRP